MRAVRDLACVSQLDRCKCTFAHCFLSVSHVIGQTAELSSEKNTTPLKVCTFLNLSSPLRAKVLSIFVTFMSDSL